MEAQLLVLAKSIYYCNWRRRLYFFTVCDSIQTQQPGGGDSHMKKTGMLVVSLSGVNFGFWSPFGCSGQSANILSRQGLV